MPIRALRRPKTVAVIAHSGKSLDGGLPELRRVLAAKGIDDPLWYEVPKSRKAPKAARRVLAQGAELVFVWGGDGMVQRCIDALAGTKAVIAILPAGPRISSRRTCASRPISPRRCGSASTATAVRSTPDR